MSDERGQLHPGARELMDQLGADMEVVGRALREVRRHADVARENLRLNPGKALDHLGYLTGQCGRIEDALVRLEAMARNDLTRLLQRRAKLDAAERERQDEIALMRQHNERIAALLGAIGAPPPAIIPFPKDRTG